MEAVSLEEVSFAYDEVPVLEKVSFQVEEGEYVGIFGPNGGGKTTLFKLILGFIKPQRGKILLFGKTPEEARKEIAYVPQSLIYDKEFPISVLEVVLQGVLGKLPWYGKYSEDEKESALHALHLVGLCNLQDRAFGTLSGGQAQRVLIARALISKPKLLLLDEPTANVDAKAEQEIYELLNTLKKEMTILMITHDLKTAIKQVERVFCVQREVIALKPEEVCEHFALGLYHSPLIKEE